MVRTSRDRFLARLLLAVALLAAHGLALAAAGKVLFVSGPASLVRNGARALNKGDALEVGDVIVTGDKARVQILMADGAKIALRAGTRWRIDEFAMPPTVGTPAQASVVNANGKSVASLLKGGFRTQTGTIGKTDRAAYEVRTPIGTLGIRGTDYTAVFCVGDCSDAPGVQPGQQIRDGMYLGVTEGAIEFVGGGRQIGLSAGQYAFIPLSGDRPEPLQTPPAFLEEDGAGPLTIGGAAAPPGGTRDTSKAASAQLGDDFNDRRSPAEGQGEGKGEGRNAEVEQPKTATGPNGQPVDLTGGGVPNRGNDIAFAIGTLGNSNGLDAAVANLNGEFAVDTDGLLVSLTAPVTRGGALGTIAFGALSEHIENGTHAGTGISWGRWGGDVVNITPPAPGQPFTQSLALQNLHWLLGPSYSLSPVLPVTGTATYTLVGSTSPTDTLGQSGTLGAASFSADFTNRTVASALTLNVAGRDWFASGTGTWAAGSNRFSGNYNNVQIGGLVAGTGTLSGFLVEPGFGTATVSGAGVTYSLRDSLGQLGIVSGAMVFQAGAGQPVNPPAPQRRDTAFSLIGLQTLAVQENTAAEYSLDANFNLSRFTARFPVDPPEPAFYAIGTSTLAQSGVDAVTMMRWGRWSGGAAVITTQVSNQTFSQDLTQESLHWIESGNAQNPPAIPTTGTATYTLVGGTSPTDNAGNVGVLNSATFDANFTTQLVNASLDLTISGQNWVASGEGPIGAQANLPAHQFFGSLVGQVNPTQNPIQGAFTGFFSGPGGTVPGVPGGAGFTYILLDQLGTLNPITGAVVFRGP